MARTPACIVLALALGGALPGPAEATDAPDRSSPQATDAPDRSSPQASVLGFLRACRDGDYEQASRHLNLAPVPEAQRAARAPVLARQLKAVLDRSLWVDVEALSTASEGDGDDGLPPLRDRVGTIERPGGDVDVVVERLQRDGESVWLISAGTVAAVPALAEEMGVSTLLARLPDPLVDVRLLEIALWQWLVLLAALLAAYLLAWLLASAAVRALRPLAARSRSDLDDRLLALLVGPLRLLATVWLVSLAVLPLGLAVPARRFFEGAAVVLSMVGVTWLLFRGVDLAAAVVADRMEREQRTTAGHLVPLGARTLKAAIGALAVLAALDNVGLDVTAVLAGLGVGGIAVALAAQKTLENVFGGVTVLADQPVRPGEFCRFGDQIGTVEDIGLRSTRVRTLDRTLITVPNADFSTLQIENYAERDRIRLTTTFGLRYETSPDQLRHVIAELRALLLAHPRVLPDPLRVRFVAFGASSLDLEVFCYVDTRDWNEFLAIREDLYLRMMDVVEASGTGFAFPSQTTYLARDEAPDAERAAEAEARVAEWRDWPPEGSPGRG